MIDIDSTEIMAEDDITASEIEDLKMLFSTPIGSIPMERDKGIDISFLSMPTEVAKNMYSVEIIKKVKKYSNNIEVSEILFSDDGFGKIRTKVVVYRVE